MPARSKLSPEQWAEARRLRADGATWVEIAAQFTIHATSVRKRALREGWWTPEQARGAPPGTLRAASPSTAGIRGRLAQRLYKVIECNIRMMELRMTKQLQAHLQAHENDPDGAAPPAPGKDERESFAALIESINKVTEMASEPAPAAAGPVVGKRKSAVPVNPGLAALSDDVDPDGLAIASEKDALRREIAERLEKIFPPSSGS
jgi:hypothetical protein